MGAGTIMTERTFKTSFKYGTPNLVKARAMKEREGCQRAIFTDERL